MRTDEPHGTGVWWEDDSAVVADPGAEEAYLFTNYTLGPGVILSGGGNGSALGNPHYTPRLHSTRVAGSVAEMVSFRTFLLVTDSSEPERFGLCVRRLYRAWAPQIQENPIFFHATDTSTAGFQLEIDQMAATGFEMLIYSFGTDFNLENAAPAYVAQVAAQVAYAHRKGIEVGGYDLICLQRGEGGYGGNVGVQWDTVLPSGGLGEDACFASGWVDKLTNFTNTFVGTAGLSMVETDGPYGGAPCASTNHSRHAALSDSIYQQTRTQAEYYSALRASNVYVNQPDDFAFFGGQRTGIGCKEYRIKPLWRESVPKLAFYNSHCSLRSPQTMRISTTCHRGKTLQLRV